MDFQNVTISKEGLARFLQRMRHLEGIHVAALDKSWSAAAFAAVATYERLKLLHVPSIYDTWFDDIKAPPTFPALKQLYTLGTTGKALLRLHSANPGIEAIHLYNGSLTGPEDVLSAASNFARLTNFKYQPGPGTIVSGRDLVKLAGGCPDLTYLAIGQDQAVDPEFVDIDDSVIYSIAQSLPALTEFHLIGRPDTYPSIKAILSAFNQHCPLLNRLEICCGSDWVAFGHASSQQWLFNHLWTLSLYPRVHMDLILSEIGYEALLRHFKSFAPGWFPKLEFFNIIEADDREQNFNDYMFEIWYKRENGSDAGSNGDEDELIEEDNDAEPTAGLIEGVATLDLTRA
ncbi:hypothetical protein N0V86_009585 [Didymella sp. IMI 355093]|nr:hypothetical protein N0V86_009585 [Didymella sp. IMI 355093]